MTNDENKSRSIRDIAEDIAGKLPDPPRSGHDVSGEPRIPKGNAGGGEWTTGGSNPRQNKSQQSEPRQSRKPNSHGLIQLPQNVPHAGYYNYGTPQDGKAQYGRPETIEVIEDVGKKWEASGAPPFGVGNMSLEDGRPYDKHVDHGDGLSIDIRPIRKDGDQAGVGYKSSAYDQQATQRLVDMLWKTGKIDQILFNDPNVSGVKRYEGHDNHIHVHVRNSPAP